MVKAVLSSKVTRAEDVKPVPVMVNVKGVCVFTCAALSELMEGTSLSRVTLADAVLVGAAVLTASTVTVLDDGTLRGAVYLPVRSMVPVAAPPPATLLTRQVTALTVLLVTVAWKAC